MKNHTEEFNRLKRYFSEIRAYNKGSGLDVNKFANLFLFEIVNINIQYQTFGKCLLNIDELITVRNMINRVIGNRNINKDLRVRINRENLEFNEMIEVLRISFRAEDTLNK